jgi:hypothetical protein
MKTPRLTAATPRWIAAGLLAAGLAAAPAAEAQQRSVQPPPAAQLQAQLQRSSPWSGSGGLRAIPFGRQRGAGRREWRREAPFIRHLYRGFLGRTPSEDEVRYWVRELGSDIGPIGMVRAFMESDEFFIRQTYLGLLRREPDQSGMETFSRALRDGASRRDVLESIMQSEEFEGVMR